MLMMSTLTAQKIFGWKTHDRVIDNSSQQNPRFGEMLDRVHLHAGYYVKKWYFVVNCVSLQTFRTPLMFLHHCIILTAI